ncbi:hypothetical protein ACLHDG_08940 [Sulfurovum sp. CS9]|jgi:DNA primase|uniref:hypothetical protein n=1 Tax=Sulfurovum sp. CS9 TaxID=3391146 RepID=UPI0039E8ECB0
MVDLKQLRAEIKSALDREKTAELLSFIGYEIRRDFKFKLREDERTPSASIDSNGNIKDFGSGWYGDIIALLHEHQGQTLKDATIYIASCLGIRYE